MPDYTPAQLLVSLFILSLSIFLIVIFILIWVNTNKLVLPSGFLKMLEACHCLLLSAAPPPATSTIVSKLLGFCKTQKKIARQTMTRARTCIPGQTVYAILGWTGAADGVAPRG